MLFYQKKTMEPIRHIGWVKCIKLDRLEATNILPVNEKNRNFFHLKNANRTAFLH
jgi:hypothetical protein